MTPPALSDRELLLIREALQTRLAAIQSHPSYEEHRQLLNKLHIMRKVNGS